MTPASPAAADAKIHHPASSFPLARVRLLDSDFKTAQDTSIRYVLQLDADRLLAPYLQEAGLKSTASPYGSWESDGMGGHIGGHYLSACAQLFAATGDRRLLERVEKVIRVFGCCQSNADGYLGGVPGGRALGAELAAGTLDADLFTLNGRWVPLYNLHKTFAGLLDAYSYAHSEKALDLACGLADWWLGVSRHIPEKNFEEMLHTEFGGMNDAFAILASMTGKSEYLAEARRFAHRSIMTPLAEGRDELDGLHANTQIPKVVGYARLAATTGDQDSAKAADFFWDTVTGHRTVSIGGNSVREHFHSSADFDPMMLDPEGPESCNSYNMLKLAKQRFERTGDPAAVDFYERASYNHVLSSQHPEHGGLVYFTPMRPAHYRVYSTAQESMWCCVGSGLENHSRYGEMIYSHDDGELLVNLYIASELDWSDRGLHVRLLTDFPRSGVVNLKITALMETEATIRLRHPAWSSDMEVDVDGSPMNVEHDGGYVRIRRNWQGTTTVTVRLKPALKVEQLPNGSPWVSYLYGPVVLAARAGTKGVGSFLAADERMGHVASGALLPLAETPVVTAANPLDAVVLGDGTKLTAELSAIASDGSPVTVHLEPFAGIHDERYTVYWPAGPAVERLDELREMDRANADQERIIDAVTAGEQQPESDHAFTGEATRAGGKEGIHWRSATGWFSYTLMDAEDRASRLRVVFHAPDEGTHEIRLNGTELSHSLSSERDENREVIDFDISEVARSAEEGGRLVFSVHALPGATTGKLLSVQLLKAMTP